MALYNRTLLVFKYLWETSDEEHTVSLADISAYLQGCGIQKPDARILRKDIDQLIEFGVDIVHNRGVQNRYHVATRHFEVPELKLLIDAVQSSRFITSKKSKDLIGKLATFTGPHHTELLRHDGRRYSVSPYALIWNNDTHYLIGYHDARGIVTKFRAMLGGRDCEVELLCGNDLMGNIIDRFGGEVITEIVDEGHFKATVTVALSNNFYGWVFASAGNIQILSPPEAIAEFRQLLSHYQ